MAHKVKLALPPLGLGVYLAPPGECYNAVKTALQLGYRHIDTAAFYKNESDVGRAIRDSGIPRDKIWVTTKLWVDDIVKEGSATAAFQLSLGLLNIDYIDLYLIHAPAEGVRLMAWREMEDVCRKDTAATLVFQTTESSTYPLVNQIELHPFLQHRDIVAYCQANGITLQAYSPLTKARKLADPTLMKVALQVNKTPAQVLIKWGLQKGYTSLPKSVNAIRMKENMEVFDWSIPDEAMVLLDTLEQGYRTGWDPTVWD
ncbi:aldo/keto reductase [Rhizoclosmatium globosum]|uniref:Aldo/keto reductase n=1 Tax=Rhizoclosmatium globosum TaxID=329046 RepID=A0A1Y2C2I6_9FUNG|nr:aldo/keto reductase [Rhizoclosmatium globosum]|eukprot:ORY41240.1 aldo/keto reductase [Rhizoclosmatium globosum]